MFSFQIFRKALQVIINHYDSSDIAVLCHTESRGTPILGNFSGDLNPIRLTVLVLTWRQIKVESKVTQLPDCHDLTLLV